LAYVALLALAALDATGYSFVAPVIPAIAERSDAGPTVMGALVATFALGQIAGFPLAGIGVRRQHASVVLWAALALVAAGDLLFIVRDELGVLFAARLLMGIGAGGLWIGITFAVLERFPGREQQRIAGVLAAYSVGSIVGPAIGGVGGVRGPFIAHLMLVCLAVAVVAALGAPHERTTFQPDRSALLARSFWLSTAGVLVVAIGLGALDGPLPLHFGTELSQAAIAALYVGSALVAAVAAVVAGRTQPRATLAVTVSVLALGIALAGAVETVPLWLLAVGLAGIGIGAGETAAFGVLLESTGPERIVTAMVVWSQIWSVGYLVAPVGAGAVAEGLGFGAIGLVPLAGALLVAAAFVVSPRRVVARPAR
jgi:MFS family permease